MNTPSNTSGMTGDSVFQLRCIPIPETELSIHCASSRRARRGP